MYKNALKTKILTIIILMVSLLCLTSCKDKQDVVTYSPEISFKVFNLDSTSNLNTILTVNDPNCEFNITQPEPYSCYAKFSVRKYVNGEKRNIVLTQNISGLTKNYGGESVIYKVYKNEQLIEGAKLNFSGHSFVRNEIDFFGGFVLSNELGKHVITFNIPEIKEYKLNKSTFKITVNVTLSGKKSTEIFITDGSITKKQPDMQYDGYDFYFVESNSPQLTYCVVDAETKEAVNGVSRFIEYRKVDENYAENILSRSNFSTNVKGLYACYIVYLDNVDYNSNIYKCYIFFQ